MQRLEVMLLFVGTLLLFILLLPGNHAEAEDAFEYSRLIEEGRGAELFHPHHLLYLPMQKGVYRASGMMGFDGRSYYVARSVSLAGGALALCLFLLITRRLQQQEEGPSPEHLPWIATLGLLFSYGFVRYACEVEIYLPALALALAALYAAVRAGKSTAWFIAGIILAASAILMHTINAALALVVIPCCYLLLARNVKRAVVHVALTLALAGLVYFLVHSTCGLYHPPVDTASEGWLRPGTIGKAMVGFGQCVLSANFVFAYESIVEKLVSLFPYRVFSEEVFSAAQMPGWLKVSAPLTFVVSLSALIATGGFLVFKMCQKRFFDRTLLILLLWLGGTMLPTLLLEPSNPELWILVLAPLWAVFLWLAVAARPSGRTMRLFWLLVCLLGVHNLTAGMGSVKDREGDYNFKKAEWILQQAKTADVVHTAESFVFTFYLTYWGSAEIRNVNTQGWQAGDTTYVFDDVFNPNPSIGVRYPEFAERVEATAEQLRSKCRKFYDDQFGGIWIVETEESN